jgi:anti-sigma B factor antagonist
MDINVQTTAHGACVTGEMTVYTAAALKAGLLEVAGAHSGNSFELDLSAVSEFDTAGLQLILMLSRSATAASRGFHIIACSESVRDALALCRQDALIRESPAKETST